MPTGDYKGNWTLFENPSAFCEGNGCLYFNVETEDKLCFCDPGPVIYNDCGNGTIG